MTRIFGGILFGFFFSFFSPLSVLSGERGFRPPIMGWSSWNTYRINISEDLICRQADAMVSSGLSSLGYRYINIDDGFFGYRDSTGVLHSHPERFPRGMKVVADYIHSLGLKAGIYSDAGSNTCGSIWDGDVNGVDVGLYGHESADASLFFNEWGFDFIKIDYCGAGQELALEERRRYGEICRAIDSVSGRDIGVNICRWAFPGTWAKDISDSWRISADISPNWSAVKRIIQKNLYLSAYAGDGHYNDMDMLEIGRGLTAEEEEVHFGLWCIMSSPLLIGCDLTSLPEPSLRLLKNEELIALNQDSLGLQAYVAMRNDLGYVLVKDIERLRGGVRAVALYNPSDTVCRFSVPLHCLELGGKVRVRDLIRHKMEPAVSDSLCYTLVPHSVRIFRLEGARRLDGPGKYEGEWSYLPCFNDLGRAKGVCYDSCPAASGGMVIRYLGGSPENYAEWDDVYSSEGGSYELTVYYVPGKYRKLELSVNGERYDAGKLATEGTMSSVKVVVRLRPGNNVIRMGSSYCWAPDIDCFTLTKQF